MGLLKKEEYMSFEEFHNLKGINEKDHEPDDAGILVHEGEPIVNDINLGKTRAEIKESLTNLLPGLDEETINQFTDEAMDKKLDKSELNSFASLKLESLDTSAIPENKSIVTEKEQNDFIPKVETPTIPSPGQNTKDDLGEKDDQNR